MILRSMECCVLKKVKKPSPSAITPDHIRALADLVRALATLGLVLLPHTATPPDLPKQVEQSEAR